MENEDEKEKFWLGSTPTKCDLCKSAITDFFVDGKTKFGPWAIMCLECYNELAVGLGTGRGQLYKLCESGKWVKVLWVK